MTRRVAIAGVGLSGVGDDQLTNPYALISEAARRAVEEAGLAPNAIDGFATTSLGALPPVDVAEHLGIRPTWIDSTAVGGATWEVMAAHAADAISLGRADVVLIAYGSSSRSDIKNGLRTAALDWGSRGPLQWEAPYGHTVISKYAMAARRHMYEYGTTVEQLAEIAVSARYNASLNPDATFRDPLTVEEVLAGRVIADPFTKLHCCIRSDGGAAVVLVAEDRVQDLPGVDTWDGGGHLPYVDEPMGGRNGRTGEHLGHSCIRKSRRHAAGNRCVRDLRRLHLHAPGEPRRPGLLQEG